MREYECLSKFVRNLLGVNVGGRRASPSHAEYSLRHAQSRPLARGRRVLYDASRLANGLTH